MHRLPDTTVGGENLLEGRAAERAVGRDSEGKRQKLVVEPLDHEQVHFIQHCECGGEYGQSLPDSGLHWTGLRHEGCGARHFLLGFEESTEQLAVGAGAARVMPRDGIRLRAA